MSTDTATSHRILQITLEPNEPMRLANLCGQQDENLKLVEQGLAVTVRNRGNTFQLAGPNKQVKSAANILEQLYRETEGNTLTPDMVHLFIRETGMQSATDDDSDDASQHEVIIRTSKMMIKPRGINQQGYVQAIRQHDINFGVGPAGTGKTYLAVATAVEALNQQQVQRILLVRPAVEAGEKLGFLPGDLAQKIDPYLRPLYDALYEMIGFEQVNKLIERQVIEIAPLAYMRGRTLNNAFIILDESQNTTREQMKMFLTRIGFGSTAVITGDITQIDLPRGSKSGLTHVLGVLENVAGISMTRFLSKDVVRHPLVQRIIDAYDHYESQSEHTS